MLCTYVSSLLHSLTAGLKMLFACLLYKCILIYNMGKMFMHFSLDSINFKQYIMIDCAYTNRFDCNAFLRYAALCDVRTNSYIHSPWKLSETAASSILCISPELCHQLDCCRCHRNSGRHFVSALHHQQSQHHCISPIPRALPARPPACLCIPHMQSNTIRLMLIY